MGLLHRCSIATDFGAAALKNMTLMPELRAPLFQTAGLVSGLVAVLATGTDAGQECAAAALQSLASDSTLLCSDALR